MYTGVAFSPFLFFFIYKFLSLIHRVSIYQNPNNFSKDRVDEYLNNKEYLKNFLTLLFDKATLLDAYGLFFLDGKHNSESPKETFLLLYVIKAVFFVVFVILILGIISMSIPIPNYPFISYAATVAKAITSLMAFRTTLSYMTNIVHWFRYKFFVLNNAKADAKIKQQTFDGYELWFNDVVKHREKLTKFIEQEKAARSVSNVSLKTKISDVFGYFASNRSGTEKIIYFCVFATSVVNSFTLIENSLPGITMEKDDEIQAKKILPKVLFRLFMFCVFSFPIVCIYFGITWVLGKSIYSVGIKSLGSFIQSKPIEKRSPLEIQFMQLLSLLVRKDYLDFDSLNIKKEYVNWRKQFYYELVKQIIAPTGIAFIYAFLFTAIFATWFESKPNRYKRSDQIEQKEVEEGFQMSGSDVLYRVRRYSYLCKAFIILIGMIVGFLIIYKSIVEGTHMDLSLLVHIRSTLMMKLIFGAIGLFGVSIIMFLLFY